MWENSQQDNPDNDGIEHGLRAELIPLLNPPEAVDTHRLGSDADE